MSPRNRVAGLHSICDWVGDVCVCLDHKRTAQSFPFAWNQVSAEPLHQDFPSLGFRPSLALQGPAWAWESLLPGAWEMDRQSLASVRSSAEGALGWGSGAGQFLITT